ncbi:MAG: heavy metal translocating P-type ATPase [Clostridia bacterium]|nr:heavy metal translocating P-type ATPase [Clostridia bacterium]
MKKYKVTGMSCAACSARVERAVSELGGVDACSVNLLTATLSVDGSVTEGEIKAAVERAGYGIAESEKKPRGVDRSEERRIITRLIVSAAILLPLMYLSMGYTMWGFPLPAILVENPISIAIIQTVLSAAVMIINRRFFISGTLGLVRGAPNMDTLVALGSFASFIYSVGVIFTMTDHNTAHGALHGLYFESAAMILVLITVGKLLEARAKGRTTDAIERLIDLSPKRATVIRDGREMEIAAEEIVKGDVFLVRAGENIAVDGVVIEGSATVVEAALTGESMPIEKSVGSRVFGATSCRQGFLKCEATEVGEDTVIASVIRLVSDATASKAPIAKLADRVSGIFVPVVMIIAAVTTAIWWIFGSAGFGYALARGISVLVISCPCSLGLATPVAIMVGSGVGAGRGILFKTAESLELSGRARIVAFDKTGTLTEGEPTVTDVIPTAEVTGDEIILLAASLEHASEHPLARAIVRRAEGAKLNTVWDFEAKVGFGVTGKIENRTLACGNPAFISTVARINDEAERICARLAAEGKTPMLLARDGELLGIIAARDEIKSDAKDAVSALSRMGIRVVMLTGDNERTARAIADEVGVSEVYAGTLPADKERILGELSAEGRVIMVGDGINDSPALARADVGMAIGGGTDIAIDSADVVLAGSSLACVPEAIALSRATLRNIKENLFWAFIYNTIGIPVAAGALIPLFGIELSPMLGALAMSLSSFCVVLNALRLNFFKFNKKDGNSADSNKKDGKAAELNENKIKTIEKEVKKMTKTMKIEGMMCPHCEARVKSTLEGLAGVEFAEVSHKSGTAVVTLAADIDSSVLADAVTAQGYKVLDVE